VGCTADKVHHTGEAEGASWYREAEGASWYREAEGAPVRLKVHHIGVVRLMVHKTKNTPVLVGCIHACSV